MAAEKIIPGEPKKGVPKKQTPEAIFLRICRSKSLISIVNSIENNQIREKSASGGVVTLLVCTLHVATLRAEVRAAREGSDAEHISVCVRPNRRTVFVHQRGKDGCTVYISFDH